MEIGQMFKGRRLGALDFGERRIGFAVCDELHISVTPRGYLENTPLVFQHLKDRVGEENIAALVVGMPLRIDGGANRMTDLINNFITELQKRVGIPIFTIDESFSTRRAWSLMHEMKTPRKKSHKKGRKDEVAAALILREFLVENG